MSASPLPVEAASIGLPSPSVSRENAQSDPLGKIWSKFEARLQTLYSMIIDIRPLPDQFPFDFALKSYIWRAIYMTSFTLGARLGGLSLVEGLVDSPPSWITFFLFYLMMPFGILLAHRAAVFYCEKEHIPSSVMDVRVCLIAFSFAMGIAGAAYNGHYYIDKGPPSYFMPVMVAVSFQLVGPRLADSRPNLVATCVGGAFSVGLAVAYALDSLSLATICWLLIAALIAAMNLQILIGELLIGNVDMTEAHIIAVMTALYQHTALCRLLGQYSDHPDRQRTHLSLRKAIFN